MAPNSILFTLSASVNSFLSTFTFPPFCLRSFFLEGITFQSFLVIVPLQCWSELWSAQSLSCPLEGRKSIGLKHWANMFYESHENNHNSYIVGQRAAVRHTSISSFNIMKSEQMSIISRRIIHRPEHKRNPSLG